MDTLSHASGPKLPQQCDYLGPEQEEHLKQDWAEGGWDDLRRPGTKGWVGILINTSALLTARHRGSVTHQGLDPGLPPSPAG